jgi:muramoyltetrapeptide carboxypeptidase
MSVRFPGPLRKGDTVGVTAFSSGVDESVTPRLEHVLEQLTRQGFRVDEGQCLRKRYPSLPIDKGASASAIERAAELNELLHDPKVRTIAPPWGGELAIQVLPFIDFGGLGKLEPKWVFGFSDVSTLLVPLTLCAGWATLHCSNLMDLSASQHDPLTSTVLDVLAAEPEQEIVQHASAHWQLTHSDWGEDVAVGFNLTEPTEWKLLKEHPTQDGTAAAVFEGRLIGGCVDTLRHLAGTPYGDVPAYISRNRERRENTVLYLENCELAPFDLARTLCGLRLAGWFDGLSGLMLGRSSGPITTSNHEPYTYDDVLQQCLADLPYPVLYDLDIGHRQPQLCLVNGALARIQFENGTGVVTQRLM